MTSAVASRPALLTALGAVTASVVMGTATPAEAATLKQAALNAAKTRIGKPYVYGATGPNSFDCSGLTQWSYKQAEKSIPRTAQQQYNSTGHVSPGSRKTGDLIFVANSRGVYHAGFYAGFWDGRGWMLDAPKPGRTVGYHQIRYYTAGPSNWALYGEVR